ncbi:bestrophin, RFP-TM, chloride channel [Nitzschia inconspicua]|uniref:Bestrophin, RFP-TM, chloride channel n=1 Tax=Nitzschia inconspicua TaxID=303405 RepID=A0A9K3P810_9STRA|nr:bestrophin, RFP-TM, chloride channel [Nitzschia inconspicua]KAG7358867.1 bestrophin, RFP-TM, chloride channel [Nitzschia inconspicua]
MTSLTPHFLREDLGYSRTVSYTSKNSWSLIFQRWGSLNPKLFPYCFVNTLLCVVLVVLLEVFGLDLTISEFGHEFMSVLVSFLVISKLSYTISLYYELQGHLSDMNQAAIDMTQLACTFTGRNNGEKYREWRYEVTLHVATMLMATAAVVSKGGENDVWDKIKFLESRRDHDILLNLPNDFGRIFCSRERVDYPKEMYVMGHNLKSDLNLRLPIRVAQYLRNTIMTHQSLPQPLHPMQEMQLMDRVKDFMNSYRGIRKYLVAPLPLPWVQLGRIFVIAYVFTLPFALLSPDLNLAGVEVILTTFLITYGFLGCEFLFVELDDPFAEDPNDLPLAEECRAAVEDILLSLYFVDGKDAAVKLESQIPTFGGRNDDGDTVDDQTMKSLEKTKTEADTLL